MDDRSAIRPIAENRKARHDFEIIDTLEAGLALTGSEAKSLRTGKATIAEAYVRFEGGETWLVDAHIAPYEQASHNNHVPTRKRKLLLRQEEADKWSRKVLEKGLTAIPLKMYFKGSWAKVEIGLGRGRKLHDKRQVLKERDDRLEMDRARRRG